MATDSGHALTFGTLLRRHRRAGGLTQEALAERAGVSARSISDLERGARDTPHRDTVRLLADALGLPDAERAAFLRAAGRPRVPAPTSSPRNAPPTVTGNTAPPFVGRQRELALLERHLAGEGPPVLLLAGEPGIGKSRLLAEASPRATACGWRVLAGGCQRQGGQEPYAPLLEALQRHLHAQSPQDLRAQLRGCAWLVRLLPELADGPIPPLPPWTAAPEQERRLMTEAVRQLLANVAGPAGTLLLLDDLQWAGQDALDLLGGLLRTPATPPLRLVAAYRDTELPREAPLATLLADLAPAGLAARRAIGPLPATEAAQLLDELLGPAAGDATRHEALLRRTGGVPFFLVSCALALREGEDQDGEAAPWTVTQSVRRRMAALPEPAREALRAAAVVGRVVERRILLAMLPRSREQVLDALEIVCGARLLEEEDRDRYRFAHDVVREVVEGDLSAARRAALHQLAGEALERLPGAPSIEALAYHYARSDAHDKAALYLEQAGDQALARHAYLAAEEHYRDLIRCLESLGRRYEAARVYARLGLLLMRTGHNAESLVALRQVIETYGASAGATPREPRPPAATAGAARRPLGDSPANADAVLALMDEREPERTRGVLYLAYAQYCCCSSWGPGHLTVTERTVGLARRLHDDLLLAQALEARGMALFMAGRRDEALAAVQEALQLCEAGGNLGMLADVLTTLVFAHVHRGEFDQANRYNDRTREIAEAIGDTHAAAWAHERRAWIAKFTGDWEQAQADLTRALHLAPDVAHDPWFACMRGELCLVQGAWDDAAAFFAQSLAAAEAVGVVSAQTCTNVFLAELDLLQARPTVALARAHAMVARDQGEYTPILLTWAALAYLHLGDVEQAATTLQRAVASAIEMDDRLQLLEALRVQALLAATQERWHEAEQSLEAGLALSRRLGYPYAEGRFLHAYGHMHTLAGELEPAQGRLQAALAIFQRLGARRDVERVSQDLRGVALPVE